MLLITSVFTECSLLKITSVKHPKVWLVLILF